MVAAKAWYAHNTTRTKLTTCFCQCIWVSMSLKNFQMRKIMFESFIRSNLSWNRLTVLLKIHLHTISVTKFRSKNLQQFYTFSLQSTGSTINIGQIYNQHLPPPPTPTEYQLVVGIQSPVVTLHYNKKNQRTLLSLYKMVPFRLL